MSGRRSSQFRPPSPQPMAGIAIDLMPYSSIVAECRLVLAR